jgi:CBS domain-containing protein
MHVRDCMSESVRITSPEQSIGEAAQLMKDCDAGALPVGENERLVGMITDRDIAIRAVAAGRDAKTPVREVMTREIQYVFEDDDLDEAAAKMSELKVRRLPVLNQAKRLVGVISLADMARSPKHGSEALSGVSMPGGPHATT